MEELKQTKGEIARVITDWETFYAPKNLIKDNNSVSLLADYVLKHHGGIFSFTSLNDAVTALAAKVLQPEPPKKTREQLAAEFQAKENARIAKERAENAIPFTERGKKEENPISFTERAKALAVKNQVDTEAKRQADAQTAINNIILDYSVNAGPGRIDAVKTEEGRKALRGIRIQRGGKYDAVLTLQVIQSAYTEETPASIVRAAERAKMNLETGEEDSKARRRAEEKKLGR